jgi:hypothetical protein
VRRTIPRVLVLPCLLLCGCIGIPVHVSSVEDDVPRQAATIVAGQTERAQVRKSLGPPLISSDYWRFDAFRITEWNAGVIVFGGGIPVPAWSKEDGYILVAYDEGGRAADVQYGIRRGGSWVDPASAWRSAAVSTRELRLSAAGDEVFMTVPADRRDRYLEEPSKGERCGVLVGALEGVRQIEILVDGKAAPRLTDRMSGSLLLLRLAPGTHQIYVIGGPRMGLELRCETSRTLYLALSSQTGGEKSRRRPITLSLSGEMPGDFATRDLLIWGNGEWLVETEAGATSDSPRQ